MEEVTLAKVFSVKSNQNDLLYYSKLCAISISSDQISLWVTSFFPKFHRVLLLLVKI